MNPTLNYKGLHSKLRENRNSAQYEVIGGSQNYHLRETKSRVHHRRVNSTIKETNSEALNKSFD